jgi:glycosyltransferase involved in cell wall biosynthesis
MPDITPILLSICIPAYKRIEYLTRLFDSISLQNFRDFEVIVTDDSSNDSVEKLCMGYMGKFPIRYFKNVNTLGTPENWNESIRLAKGEWIKIMHDDDWFADQNSLGEYARSIKENPEVDFFFSAFENHYLDLSSTKKIRPNRFRLSRLLRNPTTILSANIIGPPSVTLYRKKAEIYYDKQLKWLVDVDFYIRFLTSHKVLYLDNVLVCVGLGKEQVTQDCFLQRPVEIPENFYLLNKIGTPALKNVFVYDAWWRLLRNLEIRNEAEIRESGYDGVIPKPIAAMIERQKDIPKSVLKIGLVSKFLMFLLFLRERKSI